MSRIFGIIDPCTLSLENNLKLMASASSYSSTWSGKNYIQNQMALGWQGWSKPNIAKENGLYCILDGSIYNRNDFGKFKTDAELFLSIFQKYGFGNTLLKINGDFSIGLYNTHSQQLWIARDRFGIKPLYYIHKNETFAFASRSKALLELDFVNRDFNKQFVALFASSHYRYFDNNPQESPYREISQLPARHYLLYKNNKVLIKKYWDLEEKGNINHSEDELAQIYRTLLQDAVDIRYKSSQKPGFTLSGGMDSSSVLSMAVLNTQKKQDALSTVYHDKTYDESDEISSMFETQVKKWHPIHIGNPHLLDSVGEMIDLHDEPVATATWLSHFQLCQETQKKCFSSLFGGLGGDELNAGEYEHFFYFFADLKKQNKISTLEHEVQKWIEYHDHPIFKKSMHLVNETFLKCMNLSKPGQCLPDLKRLLRYEKILNKDFFELHHFQPYQPTPFKSYLKNRTYQDIFLETLPCCLRAEDRQTMAHNLDNFLPFLDYRLVEFMFQIPETLKIKNGITKHLLRCAMKNILPEETRTRIKKTGWNAPAHIWFLPQNQDYLFDMIHSQKFKNRCIYNIKQLDNLVKEHHEIIELNTPVDNHMMILWQLVNLEIWFRKYIDIN